MWISSLRGSVWPNFELRLGSARSAWQYQGLALGSAGWLALNGLAECAGRCRT